LQRVIPAILAIVSGMHPGQQEEKETS